MCYHRILPLTLVLHLFTAAPSTRAAEPEDLAAARARQWAPIPLDAFSDSIHHAVMRFENQKAPYAQHTPDEIVHIAENLIAWQNPDGGWPKNKDWTKVLAPDDLAAIARRDPSTKGERSTLDNRNTWAQIDYLARVHAQTGLDRCARAAIRAIEHLLREQRRSGGWRGSDVEAITFNDEVTVGVLRTLKAIIEERELYSFVDPPLLARVESAFDRGLECVLKCQIRVGDRLTVWGQQHDHDTFQPIWARAFEPPSMVSSESVEIVRLLMTLDGPTTDVVRAIESAVTWLDKAKIIGLRIEDVPAEPVHFPFHWADFDRVEVHDPAAPPIWSRFYDLRTERPIFCTRLKVVTENYADVGRERRTGYGWYGYWPASLLKNEYPRWKEARKRDNGAG